MIDWALSGAAPKLFDHEFLDRVREKIASSDEAWAALSDAEKQAQSDEFWPYRTMLEPGGASSITENTVCYDLELEDALKIVKKRLEMCDFATGFIFAFWRCQKYLSAEKVLKLFVALEEKVGCKVDLHGLYTVELYMNL